MVHGPPGLGKSTLINAINVELFQHREAIVDSVSMCLCAMLLRLGSILAAAMTGPPAELGGG